MCYRFALVSFVVVLNAACNSDAIRIDSGYNQHNSNGNDLGVIYASYDEQPQYAQPVVYQKKERQHEKEQKQDFSKIPGIAGHDYPIFHSVPPTSFSCEKVPFAPGMYANVETGCQAYHVCHDGREGKQGSSFLCTNGTLFNQKEFTCDWWYNVNCAEATHYYNYNLDPLKNPYFPKPKPQEKLDEYPIQASAHHQHRVPTYIHVV